MDELIRDMTRLDSSLSKELAPRILQKTAGNAFYTGFGLIETMVSQNILYYDLSSGSWKLNMELVDTIEASSNVVQFLIATVVKTTPPEVIGMISYCAMVGTSFDVETVSFLTQRSVENVEGC